MAEISLKQLPGLGWLARSRSATTNVKVKGKGAPGGNGGGRGLPPPIRPASHEPPQENVISSVGDIPSYKKILTIGDDRYEVGDAHRDMLIALALTNGEVWILAEPQFRKNSYAHVNQLRQQLASNLQPVSKVVLATKELITSLYASATRVNNLAADDDYSATEKQLFDTLVHYGYQERASDIHIEVRGSTGEVRFRVHSELEPMKTPEKGIYITEMLTQSISYAFNKLGEPGTHSHGNFNKDLNQSVTIPYVIDGHAFNLRYQSMKVFDGFDVIIRFLQQRAFRPVNDFVDLGYSADQSAAIRASNTTLKGMVVIAGIPGSGKSTALKYMIRFTPDLRRRKVVLIEDPVEEPVEYTSQISIQRSMKVTAESAQYSPYAEIGPILLRANVNIAVAGEIRDVDSADLALSVMESGIKTGATLHAHSIMGMFPRLTEKKIGFTRDTLTSQQFLNLLICQDLVPVLCSCKLHASEHVPEIVDFVADRFRLSTENMYVKNPNGCEKCHGRGTTDSTIVAELLAPDRKFLQLIREGDDYGAEVHWRSSCDHRYDTPNMKGKTIFEHALYKAYLGEIDIRIPERFESYDRYERLWEINE
ncbi:GspE/PulE family protein [Herbaspirillum seropedicae]|uniref:GspE/PulE family protein n=1 Tax=Herbaspirillum seropedicae TaxID=964 RepID=UPI00285658B8|nr:ATPase, T2SS/T4P/T4SS family [Herbaspirillum seropedicae]MDR6398063.1 type II secretory ATPase GspE/PulE/Tfp pilus assembly ATPase PilB-like protein [Herbaspirillum seropedicae]